MEKLCCSVFESYRDFSSNEKGSNEALWLDFASHVTRQIQSALFEHIITMIF